MTVQKLAAELRQRQYALGRVDRNTIDLLSDYELIDSYNTCSCCGEDLLDEGSLSLAIYLAKDAKQFFRICDEMLAAQRLDGGSQ